MPLLQLLVHLKSLRLMTLLKGWFMRRKSLVAKVEKDLSWKMWIPCFSHLRHLHLLPDVWKKNQSLSHHLKNISKRLSLQDLEESRYVG